MGLIQIDSVNVLVRSQELPLFARLGPHPRSLIADATAARRAVRVLGPRGVPRARRTAPEPAVVRWRRTTAGGRWRAFAATTRSSSTTSWPGCRDEGPLVAGDLQQRVGPKGTWWDWDDGKIALEALLHAGALTAVRRPSDFARVYDLTERVIPRRILALPTPTEHEARKNLLELAARASRHRHASAT